MNTASKKKSQWVWVDADKKNNIGDKPYLSLSLSLSPQDDNNDYVKRTLFPT